MLSRPGSVPSELRQRDGGESRVLAVIPPQGPTGWYKWGHTATSWGLLDFVGRRGTNAGGVERSCPGEEPCGGGTRGGSGGLHRGGDSAAAFGGPERGKTRSDAQRGLPSPLVQPRRSSGSAQVPSPHRCSRASPSRRGCSRDRGAVGDGGMSLGVLPGRASEGCRRRRGAGGQGPRRRAAACPPRLRRAGSCRRGGACQPAGEPTVRRVALR